MTTVESNKRFASHTAASFYVKCLLSACENCGLNSLRLMALSNLAKEPLEDPEARFNLGDLKLLWRNIENQSQDCRIGLKIGENMPAGHWGLIEMLALHSTTLEEAFQFALKYWRLVTDTGNEFKLEQSKDSIKLSFVSVYYDFPLANEADMAYLLKQIKLLLGSNIEPIEIQLTHSLHDGLCESDYRPYFHAPTQFNQPCNSIMLPIEVLKRPIAGSNSHLKLVIDNIASQQLKALSESITISDKVATYIHNGLNSLDAVANALNMSERTLQRRLKSEGESFKDILEQYRKNKTHQLLQDGTYTLQQISFLLGYKDERGFYDAVRRWFDTSPSVVAKRFRNKQS